MVAIGGLFIPQATLAKLPLVMQIVLGQPLILGTVLLIILHGLLNSLRHREVLAGSVEAEPRGEVAAQQDFSGSRS
jgi:hypothetical protein